MSHIQPPSERFETTVSHGLFSGKDMLMETDIHAIEQEEMVAHAETVVTDLERLAGCGFTSEESVALLQQANVGVDSHTLQVSNQARAFEQSFARQPLVTRHAWLVLHYASLVQGR